MTSRGRKKKEKRRAKQELAQVQEVANEQASDEPGTDENDGGE